MTDAATGSTRLDANEVALALVLTIATGIVDAIGFTRLFHVFPANQTGNLVLLGISVGDPALDEWWRPAAAMAAFAVGVAVAWLLGRDRGPTRRRAPLLGIECVLLVAVALLAGDVTPLEPSVRGPHLALVLALASLAMGIQTVVIGRVAGIAMSTTFETEAIVRLAETTVDGTHRPPERIRTILVLTAVLLAYSGGAAIGTVTAAHWGGVLWIPAFVVGIGAVWSTVRWWRHED